jgi:hypothetical protein
MKEGKNKINFNFSFMFSPILFYGTITSQCLKGVWDALINEGQNGAECFDTLLTLKFLGTNFDMQRRTNKIHSSKHSCSLYASRLNSKCVICNPELNTSETD